MGVESIQIGIFRHGASRYSQRETALEEANDLTEEGIEKVIANAGEFAKALSPARKVAMYSSPMGRALHTAKIISGVLHGKGLPVQQCSIEHLLTEVLNFRWSLFAPLVNGGEVSYNGSTFAVDARQTNPEGLSEQSYFMADNSQEIAQRLRGKLPDAYIDALAQFEKYPSVSARMDRFLGGIDDCQSDVIAVTHEALLCRILHDATEGRVNSLEPGSYVHLSRRVYGAYVLNAGKSEVNKGVIIHADC